MTYATSAFAMVEQHPRAALDYDITAQCGGGYAQPDEHGELRTCPERGGWQLTRPWGERYQHTYCTRHSAERLRADERMRAAALIAEQRRTTT